MIDSRIQIRDVGQPHIPDCTPLPWNQSPDELKVTSILVDKVQHMQAFEPEWSFDNLTTKEGNMSSAPIKLHYKQKNILEINYKYIL